MDQFLQSFDESKGQELDRCTELHRKIEELTKAMSVALESVGANNLPSKSDFASMKEDLAFREGEVAKSKQTLEDELRVVSNLDKLRSDAAEKRRLLEAEHLSL